MAALSLPSLMQKQRCLRYEQGCGTVMICCGSVSDFGKVSVLVPNLAVKKTVRNLAISMLEAAVFPRRLASHF
jgi:hypothetical protein